MANDIHITDLANPQLTDMQKAALEFEKTLEVDLSRQSIMAEAEATVKLDDWGKDDFIKRLDLLCDQWNDDPELNNIGKLSMRNKLLQHTTSRLLIQDQWNRHPEIFDIEIREPIIVAGLPRSGTTHLLNLMASDSRLRSLPLWESYEPVPRPGEGTLDDGTDPRWHRCQRDWESMQASSPLISAMHPMDPNHIHEELELMGPNIGSYNYEWLSYAPRWRDHYYSEDQTYQYEYMRDVLKLLTWQQRNTDRPTRWVLKCPQHLEQLPILHKVFPDATIAVTQRDPIYVLRSTLYIIAYGQRLTRSRIMMDEALEYWLDRIEHLLRSCVRDRPNLPADQSIDIPFNRFIKDDVNWVEKIYAVANLEMTDKARQQLNSFVEEKQGDYGRIVYDLEGQFGVNIGELNERFRFYTETFES